MGLTKLKKQGTPKIKATKTKDTTRIKNSKTGSRFGQSQLKHSKKGMSSCMYAAGVWIFLILMLLLAFFTHGGAPSVIGAFGVIALLVAIIGFYTGIRGFREREKNYITCRIGLAANGLVILVFIMLFIRGLV